MPSKVMVATPTMLADKVYMAKLKKLISQVQILKGKKILAEVCHEPHCNLWKCLQPCNCEPFLKQTVRVDPE